MELLEVLNENRELTGEILDKNIIHREGKYHKEVALIIINDKGEILLQKRVSTKEIEPNKWAWHGGHIIAGETSIEFQKLKKELSRTKEKVEILKKAIAILTQK